jgi:hypothetical protein
LYNILIEFGIPMKLVRLIKMCLKKTCTRVCIGSNLPDEFPVQNHLKGDALSPLLFNFALEYATGNGSGAHPASHAVGTRTSFCRGKVPRA